MPRSYILCERKVKEVVQNAFKPMLNHVETAKPMLWGTTQPRDFLRKNLVFALYHDITGKGYCKIVEKIEDLGFTLNQKSFYHNTQCIRRCLAVWGKAQCNLGTRRDWDAAMRNVPERQRFENLYFFIDSSDFSLTNKGGRKQKDPYWSYKCNSKDRRYMFLIDGQEDQEDLGRLLSKGI